jgi:hypothetical protein
MRTAAVSFLAALLTGGVGASATQTGFGSVSGFVFVGTDTCPVGYANVVLTGTQLGAMTDSTGYFRMPGVPAGSYTIKIMAMGHESLEVSGVVVAPNADNGRNYVLEEFGPVLTEAEALRESLGVDVHVNSENLTCELLAKQDPFRVGDRPRFEVRIQNNGRDTIYLVPMLRCSQRTRFPRVNIAIDPPLHGLKQRARTCCTITNGLDEWDFRRVDPGATFDPLDRALSYVELQGRFTEPGTYVARFQYSTDEPDVRRWYISLVNGCVPPLVSTLLRNVPRIVLRDSVVVHVVR